MTQNPQENQVYHYQNLITSSLAGHCFNLSTKLYQKSVIRVTKIRLFNKKTVNLLIIMPMFYITC